MNKKAKISFSGKAKDSYGIPTLCRSYLIMASGEESGSATATAIPFSTDAPIPDHPEHRLVQSGGPDKALKKILEVVRNMAQNAGLKEELVHFD